MVSKTETYRLLKALHCRHGAREFGKISQKLLAISFRLVGFSRITERGVQGVDVDAADDFGEKYSTEVKTTEKDSVLFRHKDKIGLAARSRDGYRPLLGIFRLKPLSGWQFVYAENLQVGPLLIGSVPLDNRHGILEGRINPHFNDAVTSHFEGTMSGSQFYLDGILQKIGVEITEAHSSCRR
jgi:hypothetical protein